MSLLPIQPRHDFLFIDVIDRNVTIKQLGGGKVLHLLDDDSFGPDRPHNSINASHPGVRPRWARVLMVGPEVTEDEVKVGDLVLCDTLKWSHGIPLGTLDYKTVNFWRINVKDILGVDDSASPDEYLEQFTEMMTRIELKIGRI